MSFDLRALVFGQLNSDPVLNGFWGNQLYQRSAMNYEQPPHARPFGVYYLDRENYVFNPTAVRARILTVQVWCHDEPGDYYRIDQVLDRVREVLEATPHQDDFLEIRLSFKSADLFDDLLKTIMRYSRFDAVLAR